MEKRDNIIKIAQDLDGKKKHALSNELINLFSKMSSVETQEEYDGVKDEYEAFMTRVKEADSDIHDRLLKTAAFRWWDRLGDWFSGAFKGQDARENRIRQRVTDQPAGSLGIQPGASAQDTYKAVINQLTGGGQLESQIANLSTQLGTYSTAVAAAEKGALDIVRDAGAIQADIGNKVTNLKKQNRNDADVGLLIDAIAQPLVTDLKNVVQQASNPQFNGSHSSMMKAYVEGLPARYQAVLAKGGQMAQAAPEPGTEPGTETDPTAQPPPGPEGDDSGGLPPVVDTEGWEVQDPTGKKGHYNSNTGQITWEDGVTDVTPITTEQAETMRAKTTGLPGQAPQGQLPAGQPQEGLVPAGQPANESLGVQPQTALPIPPEAQQKAQEMLSMTDETQFNIALEQLKQQASNPATAEFAKAVMQSVMQSTQKNQAPLQLAPGATGVQNPAAETDSKKNVLSQTE